MRLNFRLGWFRIELSPRPKIVFDVRRTVVGASKPASARTRGQIQQAASQKRLEEQAERNRRATERAHNKQLKQMEARRKAAERARQRQLRQAAARSKAAAIASRKQQKHMLSLSKRKG